MFDRRLAWGVLAAGAIFGLAVWGVAIVDRSAAPKALDMVLVTGGDGPYWQRVAAGARAAARNQGVDLRIAMPAGDDCCEQQRAIIDDLQREPPMAVAIAPVRPEEQTAALNNLARKAKLLTLVADSPGSQRLCHVGVGGYAAGRKCAASVVDAMPLGGVVLAMASKPENTGVEARLDGLKDTLRRSSPSAGDEEEPLRWSVVECRATNASDRTESLRNALRKHADVRCIVDLSGGSVGDLLPALAEKQKQGRVKLVTFDQSEAGLAAIDAGYVHAAIVHDPFEQGYVAVSWLAGCCLRDSLGRPAVGKGSVSIHCEAVSKDRLAGFRARMGGVAVGQGG